RGRQGRCWRLGDRVAPPTSVFRPDMPDHLKPTGEIVEHLGDVFTEPSHVAAARRTSATAVVLGFVHDFLARQMIRQRLALRPGALTSRHWSVFGSGLADLFGLAGFQLLKAQL